MRGVIANFHVNMSPRLPSQTLKHKLGSEVKISGKKTIKEALLFQNQNVPNSYIKLIATPQKICSVQRMQGTMEFSKQLKKPCYITQILFAANILVTYVTILTEPDFFLQNWI